MALNCGVSAHRVVALAAGWQAAAVAVGAAGDPQALGKLSPEWFGAAVPGTAAAALRAAGRWSFDEDRDFDAQDWWYRLSFNTAAAPGVQRLLRFHGLATLAEVWLNGVKLLDSDNMFLAHEVAVDEHLRGQNELLIRFRALAPELARRRPRPKWKTRLVNSQQLRWIRTSLLGRMPGWSPPVAAVGPWRPIELIERSTVEVLEARVLPSVKSGAGCLDADIRLQLAIGADFDSATLHAGEHQAALAVERNGNEVRLAGQLRIPGVKLWWPHTHGEQPLYPVSVTLRRTTGAVLTTLNFGRTGFRTVELRTEHNGFQFRINGVPVFCRGACWTTTDIVTLTGTDADYETALRTVRDAGMNMLRVGGTMFYEADAFYERCDELGLLVWQDFMFANMDYPVGDPAFLGSVQREAKQLLERLRLSPSVVLYCGGSEVEQQAAMMGREKADWSNPWFSETLPALIRELSPGVPYWPSSPSGGDLPFQVDSGAAHYYGVGAYLRPLEDARRCGVRFASECLAFANVPEPQTIEGFLREGQSPVHHPAWKRRTPRDNGSGWDFEDVRDHYLKLLFGVDPVELRYSDMDRYLYLSRVVTGEVMTAAYSEWRRHGSSCSGALVWFYRDLWPGAGWGVVDSTGLPKSAWYYLRRVLAPVAVLITDEGLNGLALYLVNETPNPVKADLHLCLYRNGETVVVEASTPVEISPCSTQVLRGDALLGRFTDLAYAYRFGPPSHDVTIATLRDAARGTVLSESQHFPTGRARPAQELGLAAVALPQADGSWSLRVKAQKFAQAVWIDAPGWHCEDNYFHLAPGCERVLSLRAAGKPPSTFRGQVHALNARAPAPIVVDQA